MSYQKDATYNLFHRLDAGTIGYSEGEAAERRLLEIVESVADRSVSSKELFERIDDWSTRYHFSRARHCLLRPLGIQAGDRVLELGCGAGAITRYLGEVGADVTAVEGSLARARVAAARCHDLPNVTVIADDLQAAEVEGQYDWVTLIGVLEYAGVYSEAEDPYQSYLAAAIRYLKPGGKVVVAIENQLGLKYFNGCSEDHLGIPFAGIQDLYCPKKGVRTFGRRTLSEVLDQAGLLNQQWMYPYPDYKLPCVVLTDEALQHSAFETVDLLVRSNGEDYSGNTQRLFDEGLVNRVLAENGLLADFSNSFLVVASKLHEDDKKRNWQPAAIAWSFSVTSRQPGHWTETAFKADTKNHIRVDKRRLNPNAPQCIPLFNDEIICLEPAGSDYVQARQLTWKMLDAHVRNGSLEAVVAALKPWCAALLNNATTEASPLVCAGGSKHALKAQAGQKELVNTDVAVRELSLPGNAVDHTPFNIMIDKQGKQHLIDQEWVASCRVPAGWVVTRGTFHAIHVGITPQDRLGSIEQVVIALLEACGYHATQEDVEQWMEMERHFLNVLLGGVQPLKLSTLTQSPFQLMSESIGALKTEVCHLKAALSWERQVIQDMQCSTSWRITAPVRRMGALLKRMRRRFCF